MIRAYPRQQLRSNIVATSGVYVRRMFDVGNSLSAPLEVAQRKLDAAASATAVNTGNSSARMADVAQQAIFTEVLMNAMHARLAEIKSVTK